MRTLVFKSRKHSVVTLKDGKVYKIPSEYLVEEVERLLELQIVQKRIEATEIQESIKDVQIDNLYANIFNQIEIIFQHFQPEVTIEYLKKHITHSEALEMIGFFNKYRKLILKENDSTKQVEAKKKDRLDDSDLRDLCRIMTFMVINGFSLLELRKLYIDELYLYYEELFYSLEKMGKVEEGTYDNIISSNHEEKTDNTIAKLREQMLKSISDKK